MLSRVERGMVVSGTAMPRTGLTKPLTTPAMPRPKSRSARAATVFSRLILMRSPRLPPPRAARRARRRPVLLRGGRALDELHADELQLPLDQSLLARGARRQADDVDLEEVAWPLERLEHAQEAVVGAA